MFTAPTGTCVTLPLGPGSKPPDLVSRLHFMKKRDIKTLEIIPSSNHPLSRQYSVRTFR